MAKVWTLPPKHPLRSKAVWASIASVALGIYEIVQSYKPEWPEVKDGIYMLLAGFGVYGLRAAKQTLGNPEALPVPVAATVTPQEAASTQLPDAADPIYDRATS